MQNALTCHKLPGITNSSSNNHVQQLQLLNGNSGRGVSEGRGQHTINKRTDLRTYVLAIVLHLRFAKLAASWGFACELRALNKRK